MTRYIALPETATLLSQGANGPAGADKARGIITRFAPSPNGDLHIGHALSAICAHDFARAHGGKFLLRIEDIDGTRSRAEYIETIIADMKWLGLDHDEEVIFQSRRLDGYRAALEWLQAADLLYRCSCTRSQITVAIKEHPVPHGPDGPIYPGTCRGRHVDESAPHSWRLDMAKAVRLLEARAGSMKWLDLEAGEQLADPALFGDVVLWRKDAPASYHLAATVDDAADQISHVVRGKDLFAYTAVHILLQNLLSLLQPVYWHHDLIVDEHGEKLAKSRGSAALRQRREAGEDGRALAAKLRGLSA